MRVLVTGGRDYRSYEDRMWLYDGLNLLHGMKPITEIIEGGAHGFDHHAKNWVSWRNACGDTIELTTKEAAWGQFGEAAGPMRNEEMAKLRPDVVLACPGGHGTTSMIGIANRYGLKVIYLEKMPVTRAKRRGPLSEPPPVVIDAA